MAPFERWAAYTEITSAAAADERQIRFALRVTFLS